MGHKSYPGVYPRNKSRGFTQRWDFSENPDPSRNLENEFRLPRERILQTRFFRPTRSTIMERLTFRASGGQPLISPESEFARVLPWFLATRQDARLPIVANSTGGLLPRLFTLTPHKRGGYFLLHCSSLATCSPFVSAMPCVARTFLCINKIQR